MKIKVILDELALVFGHCLRLSSDSTSRHDSLTRNHSHSSIGGLNVHSWNSSLHSEMRAHVVLHTSSTSLLLLLELSLRLGMSLNLLGVAQILHLELVLVLQLLVNELVLLLSLELHLHRNLSLKAG